MLRHRRALRRHPAALLALACAAATLPGCGNSRTAVPSVTRPATSHGFATIDYSRRAGVTFRAPADWTSQPAQAPLIGTVSSGDAVIALWRYRRTEPLPDDAFTLSQARASLIGAARSRDPSLQVVRSAVTTVAGAPAVELDVIERIGGRLRRVRSMHLYVPGAEIVLEEYAPPAIFHAVDRNVFSPVKQSLKLVRASAA